MCDKGIRVRYAKLNIWLSILKGNVDMIKISLEKSKMRILLLEF